MSLRGFVRWVSGRLGLRGRDRPALPPTAAVQCPPLARTSKPQRVVQRPNESDGEVTCVPTGTVGAGPNSDEEIALAGVEQPVYEIQAARTQFSGHGPEITDLVIGLDFGTLSTRVIVRSPYVGAGRAFPVSWPVASDSPPQFLPVGLCGDPSSKLTLAKDWRNPADRNLKTDLMDHPNCRHARARAAAYLGMTLREARGYVLDTQYEAYGQYRLRWAVNVGIPSAGYDDEEVRGAFLCVARAAWSLSRCSQPMTLSAAMAGLQAAENTETIDADPDLAGIEVVPEIAALVAGYARSHHRRQGLHVMMDVGASTIDICGFGLQDSDGDDQYFLHTALVRRLGIHELHRRRMEKIDLSSPQPSLRVPQSLDPFSEVSAAGTDYVEDLEDSLRNELDLIDEGYVEECTGALMSVIRQLRGRRDPNSQTWKTGLPLFRAGGGGRHWLITLAVGKADDRLSTMRPAKGIRAEPLPTLEALADARSSLRDQSSKDGRQEKGRDHRGEALGRADQSSSEHIAERLGVAFGLSFDSSGIGQITPPSEIEDVPPKSRSKPTEYVSKDQV